jgi:hypothetical protein
MFEWLFSPPVRNNQIEQWLGWECCGAWSRWETKERTFSKEPLVVDRWQDRHCSKCGKLQTRKIEQ